MSASIAEKYEVKAKELDAILTEGKTNDPQVIDLDQITRISGSKADKVAEIKNRKTEVEMLGLQVDAFNAKRIAEDAISRSQNPVDTAGLFGTAEKQEATAAETYMKSGAYKSRNLGEMVEVGNAKSWLQSFEQKAVMTSTTAWATRPTRIAAVTPIAFLPPQVTHLIPQSHPPQSAILSIDEPARPNPPTRTVPGSARPQPTTVVTTA